MSFSFNQRFLVGLLIFTICWMSAVSAFFFVNGWSFLVWGGLTVTTAGFAVLLIATWNIPRVALSELNLKLLAFGSALIFSGWAVFVLSSSFPLGILAWILFLAIGLNAIWQAFAHKKTVQRESCTGP